MVQFGIKKIWPTQSGSYVLTVPKAYIDNGLLKAGKRYKVVIEEESEKGVLHNPLSGQSFLNDFMLSFKHLSLA